MQLLAPLILYCILAIVISVFVFDYVGENTNEGPGYKVSGVIFGAIAAAILWTGVVYLEEIPGWLFLLLIAVSGSLYITAVQMWRGTFKFMAKGPLLP